MASTTAIVDFSLPKCRIRLVTFAVVIFLWLELNLVLGSRVFDRIYENIQSDLACFKRLNGTHEVGCTSSFWGNVGVIHLIENETDLNWVINKGPHSPYVLAIVPELFSVEVIEMASNSGKLSGVLLLQSNNFTYPPSFSGDQQCPNRQSSLYLNTSYNDYCPENPWNPYGTSMLFKNWNFPIFLLNDEDSVNKVVSCYKKFNKPEESGEPRNWPLCAIELHSKMYAAVNSKVCLRRSDGVTFLINLCDPLESVNIWGSVHPLNASNSIEDNSVIIVSTSADSASLFDNISPGANAAITGLVTLLACIEALFRHRDKFIDTPKKNILFIVFEGESWDYVGSSKMVYDMINNEFPYKTFKDQEDQMHKLNFSHIQSIIDMKQIGFVRKENGERVLSLHTDPISNKNPEIDAKTQSLINNLVEESKNWNITITPVDKIPLPPSSLQSFLKEQDVPGVVLSDHQVAFENKYYASIYDNYENLNYSFLPNVTNDKEDLALDLTEVASTLASSLLKILTGTSYKIEANYTVTNNLLYCFLKNMNCSYFQENSDDNVKNSLKPEPAKTFISVKRADATFSVMILRLLSRYTGQVVELNQTECESNNTQQLNLVYFPFINNGTCFETTVHHSSALSPAFVIENYDWDSNRYSTWTESTWHKSEARIFLRPSPSEEIGLLIGGVISLLSSFIIVYFCNSKANVIFNSDVTPTPC